MKDYAKKYNFNYSILRYFNVCGSDPSYDIGEYHIEEKRIIPILIKSCINNSKVYIYGDNYNTPDGTCIRDYTHVCDIASSHIKSLEYMSQNSENIICNIGSGKGYSIKELIHKIQEISQKKINFEIKPPRKGDAAKMICTNKNAKKNIKLEQNMIFAKLLKLHIYGIIIN